MRFDLNLNPIVARKGQKFTELKAFSQVKVQENWEISKLVNLEILSRLEKPSNHKISQKVVALKIKKSKIQDLDFLRGGGVQGFMFFPNLSIDFKCFSGTKK